MATLRAVSLVGLIALGCKPPQLKACEAGAVLPARAHLSACAPLIRGPVCRAALLDPELDVFEALEGCRAEYCPRLGPALEFCDGLRGSRSTKFEPEMAFFAAVFEVDHPGNEEPTRDAFASAVRRVAAEGVEKARKAKEAEHAAARVLIDVRGTAESVDIQIRRPEGIAPLAKPLDALSQADCNELIGAATRDNPVSSADTIELRPEKHVGFRAIKCLLAAIKGSGFSENSVRFATFSRR